MILKKEIVFRRLVNRFGIFIIMELCLLRFFYILDMLGIKKKGDGWRHSTRYSCQKEETKFILSCFNLDYSSDIPKKTIFPLDKAIKQVIYRLKDFLKTCPDIKWRLSGNGRFMKQVENPFIDIVCADFNDQGELIKIIPYFDDIAAPYITIDNEVLFKINKAVISVYNKLNLMENNQRQNILQKRVKREISRLNIKKTQRIKAMTYVKRMLSGIYIIFEDNSHLSPEDTKKIQFQMPEFIKMRHPGFGPLNIHCRFNENYNDIDMWIQFHHAIFDGVPAQEIISKLRKEWGITRASQYPSMDFCNKPERIRASLKNSAINDNASYIKTKAMDFTPLIKARKNLIINPLPGIESPVTLASMIAWGLSFTQDFKNVKFSIPNDLKARQGYKRTLGAVFTAPWAYKQKKDNKKAFIDYEMDFNTSLAKMEQRTGECFKFMDYCKYTPLWSMEKAFKIAPQMIEEFVGTAVITIVKDSEIFLAPRPDIFSKCVIAIGNMMIPSSDGRLLGAVSINSKKDDIDHYFSALKHAIDNFESYI